MLKIRTLTAAVFLLMFLLALFFLPLWGWVAFCAILLGIAVWEWGALAALAPGARAGYTAFLIVLFVSPLFVEQPGTNGLYAPVWLYGAAALFWVVLAPLWIWRSRSP